MGGRGSGHPIDPMPVPPITATGQNSFREGRMSTTLRLHPEDGVVIARTTLMPGAPVADGIHAAARIPAGHKMAVRPHDVGEPVRRYNQIIGFATQPIEPGQHVYVHNL